MNVALAWFGKEWRGQWRLLGSYVLLAVSSVALVCWLLPHDYWPREGSCAQALAWFFALGVVGAVLFAAPQLVRGEFAPKDDQFVRRLPGALAPALAGKLLFLVFASLLLPLLTLLCGEVALWMLGRSWGDLFVVGPHDAAVQIAWPFVAVVAAATLLLTTWVAAVGTWLPGGRMAVGGLCLLLLLIAIAVVLTMQTCPGLEQTIAWQPWLWATWPVGALLFAVSWRARRGGGEVRSAKFGLASLAACLVVPGGWLAREIWGYHHPEPQSLVDLRANGVTQDGRFALMVGAGHEEWQAHAQFRIDLATGFAEQVSEWSNWLVPASLTEWAPFTGGVHRWWRSVDDYHQARVFDLATGVSTRVASRAPHMTLDLQGELRASIADDVRANPPFRLPGGRRAWRDSDDLAVERTDGTIEMRQWPTALRDRFVRGQGHALIAWSSASAPVLYDVEHDRCVDTLKDVSDAWLVRSEWLVRDKSHGWLRLDVDTGALEPRTELQGAWCQGLFDDDRLLFVRVRSRKEKAEVFAYRPVDRRVEAIELPGDVLPGSLWSLPGIAVDVRGRRWLSADAPPQPWPGARLYVALDPVTLRAELMPVEPGEAFALVGTTVLTIEAGRRIVRTDWTTGARHVLYPIDER